MEKTSILTVGMDLGDEYSHICVLDGDAYVLEAGKVRTSEAALRGRFGAMKPCLVVMEVGTHSPWVSRLLQSLGHECLVANPASLPHKAGKKNDRVDAEKLARWGRSDPEVLHPVEHGGIEIQADMAMVHSRRSLMETRTKLINRARGLVKSWGQRLPRCDADYFPGKAANHVPPELEAAVSPLLKTISLLTSQIKDLDKHLEALAREKYPETARHCQVRGVGTLTALTYVLTLRDPMRFRVSRQVGPYLGLTRKQDQSGDSDPELGISKAGNVYLRQLLVQSAHYIIQRGPDSDLRRFGLRKAEGGKRAKRRAVVAVARKLAVLLHHLWLSGEAYEPLHLEKEVDSGLPVTTSA